MTHPRRSMWIGDVVADRFVIERPIGSGGMGSVFLAHDRAEGRPVALKVLDLGSADAIDRFRRETRMLSELAHPGIVRYVAHGDTAERRPYLAMELLEGQDLAERLARGRLSVDESLKAIRGAAEALAFAHERGIVHRDVKPSNLFLVDNDVGRLKVLDFGVARARVETRGLTQTGAVLGTVGYMAPEQAMGARDIDARVDVFALGCVLFECLTGKPAFSGAHAVAILAKVFAEEAPKVSELVPEIGASLDALVMRLLAKKTEDRPVNASAVLGLLNVPELEGALSSAQAISGPPASLTHSEQRVVSVMLAQSSNLGSEATVTPDHAPADLTAAREIATRFGAVVTPLQGGALLFVLSSAGTASDQAAAGASLALAVRQAMPGLILALATGHAETTGRLPVGAAIDRAAALIRASRESSPCVALDAVTAAFLGSKFEVREGILVGETVELGARPLLGKATPTVGRDKELALLDATLGECIDDRVARVVVVTAPPGVGKSRLGAEFMQRIRRAGRARLLFARGEVIGGRSLIESLAWNAAGVRKDFPATALRTHFHEYLRGLLPEAEARRTAEFLGEAVGIPVAEGPSAELVTARNDPRIMPLRVREAIAAWLGAEAARGPLVLMLEDLHWADPGSVGHLEAALGVLADSPFFIVALGRPEVRELFPTFVERPDGQQIRLGPLTRRAAERLVSASLGEVAAPELVARIVERAAGNVFYLEELIRSAAEGASDLPETVVVMASSRLERLEPEARRILRAASIFGEAFWTSAVAGLVGGDGAVSPWLETLAQREVLDRVTESRFPGESEYAFRHSLLRDAAYAMLSDEDRRIGHALAGEWLSRQEWCEPLAVADHFERGDTKERAIPWLVKAIERDFRVAAVPNSTHPLIARALATGVSGTERGIVRAWEAVLGVVRNDSRTMIEAGRDGIRLLPITAPEWFWAAGALVIASWISNEPALAADVIVAVLGLDSMPAATSPVGWALLSLVNGAGLFQSLGLIQDLSRRFESTAQHALRTHGEVNAAFLGYWALSRCAVSLQLDEVAGALPAAREADSHFLGGADPQGVVHVIFFRAFALAEAGELGASAREFKKAVTQYRDLGNEYMLENSMAYRDCALVEADLVEGSEALLSRLETMAAPLLDVARPTLAAFFLRTGDVQRAVECLQPITDVESHVLPYLQRVIVALHACVLLAHGAVEDALALANRAVSGHAELPMLPLHRSRILLAHAECLHAAGQRAEANAAILLARDRLLRNANGFDDPALRAAYLTNLEPNRRTMELARDWLRES